MSKTLVLAQLFRLELETKSIVVSAQSAFIDRQLLLLLQRAEQEHTRRAKELSKVLNSIHGPHEWKQELQAEQCGIMGIAEINNSEGPLELVTAAEIRLHKLYTMACSLMRLPVIMEAAAEQSDLTCRITELKAVQTQKMCRPMSA